MVGKKILKIESIKMVNYVKNKITITTVHGYVHNGVVVDDSTKHRPLTPGQIVFTGDRKAIKLETTSRRRRRRWHRHLSKIERKP